MGRASLSFVCVHGLVINGANLGHYKTQSKTLESTLSQYKLMLVKRVICFSLRKNKTMEFFEFPEIFLTA